MAIGMTSLLIQKKANVDLQSIHGTSPLMVAVNNNNLQLAKLLLDNGAKANLMNTLGANALMIAISKCNPVMMYLLVGQDKENLESVFNTVCDQGQKLKRLMQKMETVGLAASDNQSPQCDANEDNEMATCTSCDKKQTNEEDFFQKCSSCKIASYCSRSCQKTDWSQHKKWCKEVAKRRPFITELVSKVAENRYTSSTSEAAAEIEATPDCDIRDDALQDIKIKKKTPKKFCLHCNKDKSDGMSIRKCICKLARYCSQECHEKDWENHKELCLQTRKGEIEKPFDMEDVD